jgi:hypothetical protein
MATHKLLVKRPWNDLARKLIAFACASLSATAIIGIGAYFGIDVPAPVAGFIASAVGILAGYFTTGDQATDDTESA